VLTEKVVNGFRRNFLEGYQHGPGTNEFNFGDDPDHLPDREVRSPKSAFTGLSKKLPTDFDEILWKAGVWPRDQLIIFGDDPHHYPDPRVPCKNHSAIILLRLLCWLSAEVCGGLIIISTSSHLYVNFLPSLRML